MADEPAPASLPAAPAAAPAPAMTARGGPPARAVRATPSPPGPQAGMPITTTRRHQDMPPGIPPGLAGQVVTDGALPVQAPAQRHASFAPVPQAQQNFRASVSSLRVQLVNAANVGERTLAAIDSTLAAAEAMPNAAAVFAAEELDMERIQAFRASIAASLELTK